MKKKGVRFGTVFFLVVAAAFLSAVGTYYYLSNKVSDLSKNQQMYQKLDTVNQVITRNYINPIDALNGYDNILDGIVSGYIDGLGDPYSYYLNEKNYKTSAAIDGSFLDIGIRYSYDSGTGGIRVDYCKKGSPADQAGLKNGDVLIAIDDVYVTAVGYKKAVQSLYGAEGTEVSLSVVREGEASILILPVTRSSFVARTVDYRLVGNGIGYIFINEFDRTTLTDFTVAYEDLTAKGAKAFIFDVRFTFAGDLEYTVNVLDKIMPAGIVVSVKEKSSSDSQLYFSDDKHIEAPMVVLQNAQTSGVAEVFSAALRDTECARIVGEQSAGNGVGQRDIPLSDGTAIRLSTYEYVTPSGERFNGVGIEPNYTCYLDRDKAERFETLTDEEDDQLQLAVEKVKEMMGMQ